jgi:hypothetical protein
MSPIILGRQSAKAIGGQKHAACVKQQVCVATEWGPIMEAGAYGLYSCYVGAARIAVMAVVEQAPRVARKLL